MRLELAERLRCPRAHAPTPLVLVASLVVDRDLRRGDAGCPVCRYEARFVDGDLLAERAGSAIAPMDARVPVDDAALDRLIALLALAEPGGAVLLLGEYVTLARRLADRAGVDAIVDRAAAHGPSATGAGGSVSALAGFGDAIPFAEGSFRAVGLGSSVGDALAASAIRVAARGARVVGAIARTPPDGLRLLARDDHEWVAEVTGAPTIIGLSRRER